MGIIYIFIACVVCYIVGFLLGSRFSLKNFLDKACGYSIEYDTETDKLISMTYYYSEKEYQNLLLEDEELEDKEKENHDRDQDKDHDRDIDGDTYE